MESSRSSRCRAHAEQVGSTCLNSGCSKSRAISGASPIRPAPKRLRDQVCQVLVDVRLGYSLDRLARNYADPPLLIEEFAKAGTRVVFSSTARSCSPEDALGAWFVHGSAAVGCVILL
jgi:DNA invertase Pin-like site-specific DNA recombinase